MTPAVLPIPAAQPAIINEKLDITHNAILYILFILFLI